MNKTPEEKIRRELEVLVTLGIAENYAPGVKAPTEEEIKLKEFNEAFGIKVRQSQDVMAEGEMFLHKEQLEVSLELSKLELTENRYVSTSSGREIYHKILDLYKGLK